MSALCLCRILVSTAISLVTAGYLSVAIAGEQDKAPGELATDSEVKLPDALHTPNPEAKPTITPDLSPSDLPIAQRLQEILAGGSESIFDRKQDRTAIEAFYAGRGYAPLWIANGGETKRAKAVAARLKKADTDGLDPSDYPAPDFNAAAGRSDTLAQAELTLDKSVLTYARHAQAGQVHYSRVSAEIAYHLAATEPSEVLARITSAAHPADAARGV